MKNKIKGNREWGKLIRVSLEGANNKLSPQNGSGPQKNAALLYRWAAGFTCNVPPQHAQAHSYWAIVVSSFVECIFPINALLRKRTKLIWIKWGQTTNREMNSVDSREQKFTTLFSVQFIVYFKLRCFHANVCSIFISFYRAIDMIHE